MADIKISGLPTTGTAARSDEVETNTAGGAPSVKRTLAQVLAGMFNMPTGQTAAITVTGADSSHGLTITTKGSGSIVLATGDGSQVRINSTGSSVNLLTLQGGASGNGVILSADGETNIPINIVTKGSGSINFYTNAAAPVTQVSILHVASADRNITLQGGVSGSSTNATIGVSGGKLAVSAALVLSQTTLLETSATLTNGAGAGGGTLTNAPSAGNPTKWVPINDNGTTRYFPTWT